MGSINRLGSGGSARDKCGRRNEPRLILSPSILTLIQKSLVLLTISSCWGKTAHLAAHGHKAMEILGKAFVCFFVQSSKSAEAIPMELHGVRVILHTKGRHYSIEISLFTPCPSTKGRGIRQQWSEEYRETGYFLVWLRVSEYTKIEIRGKIKAQKIAEEVVKRYSVTCKNLIISK